MLLASQHYGQYLQIMKHTLQYPTLPTFVQRIQTKKNTKQKNTKKEKNIKKEKKCMCFFYYFNSFKQSI